MILPECNSNHQVPREKLLLMTGIQKLGMKLNQKRMLNFKRTGIVKEAASTSEDNTIIPINCYGHFITDEILNLIVHETNRYTE